MRAFSRDFLATVAQLFPNPKRWLRPIAVLSISTALLSQSVLAAAPQSAEDWYQQANAQYQEGDIEATVASLLKAVQLKKDYPEALVLLGNAWMESGDFAKAAGPLRRASELKPEDYAIQLAYSNALEGAGQAVPQIPVLYKLFKLNPNDVVIGIKYLTLVEKQGASKYADGYIDVLETLRKAPNADAAYGPKLGRAYVGTNQSEKAVQLYQELVGKNPENAEYWTGLADAQAKLHLAAAKESYKKAILFTENVQERKRLNQAMEAVSTEPISSPTVAASPSVPSEKVETQDKATVAKANDNKVVADKAAAEKVAAEKAAAEKAAVDKAATEKAAMAKATAEKVAAEKVAAEKAAVDKAATEKAAMAKATADKAAADKLATDKAKAEKAHNDSIATAQILAQQKLQAQKESDLAAEATRKAAAEAAVKLAAAEKAQKLKVQQDSLAIAESEKKAAAENERHAKAEALRLAVEEKERNAKEKRDSLAQAETNRKLEIAAQQKAKMEAAKLAAAEKMHADSLAHLEALARIQAKKDSSVQADLEKKNRLEAERQAKEEAAKLAREEADQKSKQRADSTQRADAEKKVRMEAEAKAREEAARLAADEAARKTKERADSLAIREGNRKQQVAEEQRFQAGVAAILGGLQSDLDTASLLMKIQEKRATSKVPDLKLLEAEGIVHFRQWNFALALQSLRKLKTLGPVGQRAYASSLAEQGDYAGALKQFIKVASPQADRALWNRYIKCLVATKQAPKAALEYEAYLAKYPDADDALAWLLQYYRRPLQKEKLAAKLEFQLTRNPNDLGMLSELVQLTELSSPKAADVRERYLKQNPDDVKIKRELAEAYEAKGRSADALKLYQEIGSNFVGDKAFNLKVGDMLVTAGKNADAIPYFENVANGDANNKRLLIRVAALHESIKQNDRALEFYNRALIVDPKDKAVQGKVLELQSGRGNDSERETLLRITTSDPTAHEAFFKLAKMSLAEGDKERAYDYLAKALAQQPNNNTYQTLVPDVVTSDAQIIDNLLVLERLALLPNAKSSLQLMVAKGYVLKKNLPAAARAFGIVYAASPKLLEGQREPILAFYAAKNFEACNALADRYLVDQNSGDKEIRAIQLASLIAAPQGDAKLRKVMTAYVINDPVSGAAYLQRLSELDLAAKDTVAALTHAKGWLETHPKDLVTLRFVLPLVKGRVGEEAFYMGVLEALAANDTAAKGRYDTELAQLHYQRGDFEDSQRMLIKATAQNPTDAALWYRLATVETQLKKDDAAKTHFAKAYELAQGNGTYAKAYGNLITKDAELKSTLPLWKYLSSQNPSNEEKRKLAVSLFLNGDYAGSADKWDGLVKGDASLALNEPRVAESYLKAGQTAKARALYEQQLKATPDNLPLLEQVAELYQKEGNAAGYVTTLEKMVQTDSKFKNYQLLLAQEKEKAKDYDAALTQYDQWVARNDNDKVALTAMHRLAEIKKDTTRLMESLVRLNRQKQVEVQYRRQLVELDYLHTGNIAALEKEVKTDATWNKGKGLLVREYLKQNQKLKLLPYEKFLESESTSDKTLLEPLADLYVLQKKTALANASYFAALKSDPQNRALFDKVFTYSSQNGSPYLSEILRIGSSQFSSDTKIKQAYARSLGKTQAALDVYQQLLVNNPQVITLAPAVELAIALQRWPLAAQWLDKWVDLEPNEVKVWESVLAIATQTGNKAKAQQALERLNQLKPERKEYALQLARVYEDQNQGAKAAEVYKRALSLDPKNRAVLNRLIALYGAQNKMAELKETLIQVDQVDPTAHEAHFQLAKLLLQEGDKERAYGFLLKALRIQPNNFEYQALLPEVVVTEGQIQEHLPVLQRLAAQPSAKPNVLLLAARGEMAKKNAIGAARWFTQIQSVRPDLLEGKRDPILALYEAKNYALAGSLANNYLSKVDAKDREIRNIQIVCFQNTATPTEKMRGALADYVNQDSVGSAKFLLKLSELDLLARDTLAALNHGKAWLARNPNDLAGLRFIYPLVKGRNGEEATYFTVLDALAKTDVTVNGRYDLELASLKFNRGDFDDAQKLVLKAANQNPSNAALWFRLGEIEMRLKKEEVAKTHYQRAYELAVGNVAYARAYGGMVIKEGELKATLGLWKYLSTQGPSVDERRKFATSLFLNGEYAASAAQWDNFVKADPNFGITEPMVAESYLRSGQTGKARGLIETRLKTDPNNLALLEQVALLYQKEGNAQGYNSTLVRIVQTDPKYKSYQLTLAQEKEKARDYAGALEQYDQWVSRNESDLAALRAMQHLAESQKDTTRLMEALVRLNRQKTVDPSFRRQLVELEYLKSGNLGGVERLVKTDLSWNRGKAILVREYLKQNQKAKLIPYEKFLEAESKSDPTLLEPLGDLYALQKKALLANATYFGALKAEPTDRPLYDKVYKYSVANKSANLSEILRIGYENFRDDFEIKRAYALTLGKTPKALEVYTEILSKQTDASTLAQAVGVAVELQRWASALQWLEKWTQLDPKNDAVWAKQLEVATQTSNREKQRSTMLGWYNANPNGGARNLLRLAEIELAVRDSASAVTHVKAWLERNPKDLPGLKLLYPMVKVKANEADTYLKVLEGLSSVDIANRGKYDLELGQVYWNRGDYEEAQKVLLRAVQANPNDAALWYRLGEVERKLHKEENAVSRFKKAYELQAGNVNYARTYGASVEKDSELKASLPLWRFLSTQGQSVEERRKFAQSLFLNGEFAAAAAQFEWFLRSDPNYGLTEPRVAEAYLKSGQTGKARALIEARLKGDPNNLALLEQVAMLYKQEGNAQNYQSTLARMVQVDPKFKNYQLLLAQEKERSKDYKGALEQYDMWVARNEDDITALKAMHRIAETQKDTARLVEALVRINRQKAVEPQYRFQMAEIDYARSGDIAGIERMLKLAPDWKQGKVITILYYSKKGQWAKLVPYTSFIAQMASEDRTYSESLGDVYAFQKKGALANEAYFAALVTNKKDKTLFDKVYKYAKATESSYRAGILKQGYDNFPNDLDLKFDYAVSQGRTQRGLDLYLEIIRSKSDYLAAIKNGAEIAILLRRNDIAEDLLRRWTNLDGNALSPWTQLADLYSQSHNDSKLAEALGRISDLSPTRAEEGYRAGMAYKKISNKSRALEYFTRAATLNPANGPYQREYGLGLFEAGQRDKAKSPLIASDRATKMDEPVNFALYQIYIGEKNNDLARERLRVLYAMRPNNTQYAYGLARLESDLKSPGEVARILERPGLKDSLNAEMSFLLLDAYFKTGQKDKALLWAPVLTRKYPEESKSSLPLGILFYESKNRGKAKEILEAYSRNKSSEEAYYYLGKVYYEEHNWSKAVDAFSHASEKREDVPSMLAQSYIENGEPQNAIRVYEDLYSKNKESKLLIELYGLYKKTKDVDGIVNILERVLQVMPQNLDYRVELAEWYRRRGETKKAEEQFDLILRKEPQHPGANLFLGMALAERKEYERAIRMLEIGTVRFPDSVRAWRLLGDAYRSEKRLMPAYQAYKKALKLDGQNISVAIARMQLAKSLSLTAEWPDAFSDVVKLDSSNLEAGSALADIRFNERRYREAAALYKNVADAKADSRDVWANFGISLLEIKAIPEAKRALQRAVDLGAKDMKILTSLARIYKEEGNVEKAEKLLNEMVKKDPRNHMAWYELGRIAIDRNQQGVAEDNFKKALQLAPGTPEYAEALARLNANRDEQAQVIRILEPIHVNLSESGRLMYGEALMKQGREEAALAEFNALYSRQKSPAVLAMLAELETNKGEPKDAVRMINESGYANDSTVQFALAKAYIGLGDGEKARGLLERLIKNSKYNASLYHWRGMSWFEEGNCNKALKDYDQALKYNPDYMDAVYHTGLCLSREGRGEEAQNYFKELSQHSAAIWSARGFMGMGLVFESQNKMEAAENYLQKAVATAELAEANGHLARIYLKLRKPNEAERVARKALQIKADEPVALGILGEVLVAQNRKQEALALSKKALQENPNSCPLLVSSAKINYSAGNFDSARQNGLYAITLCPDDAQPYLYVGLVAEKKYMKKEAKDNFKAFKKRGGDLSLIPEEYR